MVNWAIPEKSKTRALRQGGHTFLKKYPGSLRSADFTFLEIPEKTRFHLEILQNCMTPLGNSTQFYLAEHPLEIPHLFFNVI